MTIAYVVELSRENARGNRCRYKEDGRFAALEEAHRCAAEAGACGFRWRIQRVATDGPHELSRRVVQGGDR